MTLIAKAAPKFEPPRWSDYDKRATVAASTPAFAKAAVVNRFCARYRFARAFRGLVLEGYSSDTRQGYDALTKVSLHWSAFEQLLRAIKVTDARSIAARHDFAQCLSDMRAADPTNVFFQFVLSHLDSESLKAPVGEYILGKSCSALALSKAVRHIFLHGPLTPNVSGLAPSVVSAVCDALSDALVTVMDFEFERNVADLVSAYPD